MDRLRTFIVAALVGALCLPAVATADESAAPDGAREGAADASPAVVRPEVVLAPTAAPARTEAPVTVAVVGDSISQGTGSNGPGSPGGGIGSPRPAASWATGDHAGLDSYAQRLEQLRGGPVTTVNLSANGATIRDHLVDQVRAVPDGTDLVLIQMGGNDLCRSSEADMTPVDVARSEVRAALAWLREHRPDTLVSVSSIPDIYSLWYVRGAPHKGEQFPFVGFVVSGREGPRAPRSTVENNNKRTARMLWDTLGVIPCRTMLFRPNIPRNAGPIPDPTNTAEQRRLRVRDHNIALNDVLADECAAMLRCTFDGHAVFDLVANRDADGVLLADKDEWTFVDADISTQDHFHPSFAGQRKLAEAAWAAGPDWTDVTPPAGYASVHPVDGVDGPSAHGWYTGPIAIDVWFRDDAGVRGVEYRVHGADARATGGAGDPPWSQVLGDRVSVPIVRDGVSWVEARALDVNGNLSASEIVTVRIDGDAPTVSIDAPLDGEVLTLGQPVFARHTCRDGGSGIVACDASATAGSLVDTSAVGEHVVSVRAVDAAGNTTTLEHTYRVEYDWSGTTGPLERGAPREVTAGSPLPVHFVLRDDRGNPVADAGFELALVGPDGVERSITPVAGRLMRFGPDWDAWAARHDGHLTVVDTRGLVPGVWDVVVRPDDGTERRVNVLVTS